MIEQEIPVFTKILLCLLTSGGILIALCCLVGIFLDYDSVENILGKILPGRKSKGVLKVENLLKRYTKFLEKDLKGYGYENLKFTTLGSLVGDLWRDVGGERIMVKRNEIILGSVFGDSYAESILGILDKVLKETGCETVEEFEMWLEKGGF